MGGGMGLARFAAFSVGLWAVEGDESWRCDSKTRLKALPPIKVESGEMGEMWSRSDCSEAFRLGAGSPSGRLLEGRTGGGFEGFEGLGECSGREDMSWRLDG